MSTHKENKDLCLQVLRQDIDQLNETMSNVDFDAFHQAVTLLCKARRVYVIGIRNCSPLAELLSFYLNLALDNVVRVSTNSSSELIEQMLHLNNKDVVVGISFPRYSKRTLRMMEFANSRQSQVISITNSINSPMCMYSSCNLIAKSEMEDHFYSLTGAVSLVNALVKAVYKKKNKDLCDHLDILEKDWTEYQVYSIDELEYTR